MEATKKLGSLSERSPSLDKILSQLADSDLALQPQNKCWLLERLLHALDVGKGEKASIMACVNVLNTESDSSVKLKAMEVLNIITPTARQFEGRCCDQLILG